MVTVLYMGTDKVCLQLAMGSHSNLNHENWKCSFKVLFVCFVIILHELMFAYMTVLYIMCMQYPRRPQGGTESLNLDVPLVVATKCMLGIEPESGKNSQCSSPLSYLSKSCISYFVVPKYPTRSNLGRKGFGGLTIPGDTVHHRHCGEVRGQVTFTHSKGAGSEE
jgi:hypothetical protein